MEEEKTEEQKKLLKILKKREGALAKKVREQIQIQPRMIFADSSEGSKINSLKESEKSSAKGNITQPFVTHLQFHNKKKGSSKSQYSDNFNELRAGKLFNPTLQFKRRNM